MTSSKERFESTELLRNAYLVRRRNSNLSALLIYGRVAGFPAGIGQDEPAQRAGPSQRWCFSLRAALDKCSPFTLPSVAARRRRLRISDCGLRNSDCEWRIWDLGFRISDCECFDRAPRCTLRQAQDALGKDPFGKLRTRSGHALTSSGQVARMEEFSPRIARITTKRRNLGENSCNSWQRRKISENPCDSWLGKRRISENSCNSWQRGR